MLRNKLNYLFLFFLYYLNNDKILIKYINILNFYYYIKISQLIRKYDPILFQLKNKRNGKERKGKLIIDFNIFKFQYN